jgi:hypothetical protein
VVQDSFSVLVAIRLEIPCFISSTIRAHLSLFHSKSFFNLILALTPDHSVTTISFFRHIRANRTLFITSTMPRLLVNPNIAQCPDYTLAIYQAIRTTFVTPTVDNEQAAVLLTNVWTAQNVIEIQQWQDQLDQDVAEADEARREAEEAEQIRRDELDKEREDQRKEEIKKNKSKFAPIPARGVPTRPPVIASSIATRRMDKGDYIPLWYYSNAGLDDASKAFSILDEDALTLVRKEDGSSSLVPALSSKESRGVVEDHNLSWDDFCIAAPRMIQAMNRAEWPTERIVMMTEFWSNLNTHPFRSLRDPLDRNALLLYQSEQRKLWHQAINSPGHGYDLSQINEDLLRQTKDRLYWFERERKDRERDKFVSPYNFPLSPPISLTISVG